MMNLDPINWAELHRLVDANMADEMNRLAEAEKARKAALDRQDRWKLLALVLIGFLSSALIYFAGWHDGHGTF